MSFPIFPLNGVVLFPKTTLPLNIFEKRYIAMVDYALANNRLIGMIQTKNDGNLFNIGCLGKIITFNETSDGRYLISLEGLNCYEIIKELPKENLFRQVDANIIENTNQNEYDEDKSNQKKLLEKYKIYIEKNKIKLDIIELDSLKIGQLVKFITMVSPFSDSEKQMCLETKNIIDFAEKLISILDIYSKNSEENKTIN